jgi:predicted membrane channel-forming protein YqfA (hemolysin III family)
MEKLVPHSDPCAEPPSFSLSRFVLFTLVFLIFIPGSAILFFSLSDRQYGIQAASIVCYTAGVILYTFSSNRGLQRYLFRCQ